MFKKESSTLDIADEALLREADKKDAQANPEDAQPGMDLDLDLLFGDIRGSQEAVAHVDFFISEGFFGKIEHHPMFGWLLALENILRR